MKTSENKSASIPHTQKAVVQKPPVKSRKILWVAVGFIILCTVVIIGFWLANTLIKIPATPIIK